MDRREAQETAALMGMSVWTVEAIAVGKKSRAVEVMCVGFADINLVIAEGECWEEALDRASRFVSRSK